MSLIPLMFSDWWEDLDRPHRIFDQHFGGGIYPEQLLVAPRRYESLCLRPERRQNPMTMMYYRPWADLLRADDDGVGSSTIKADKDNFQVVLDVQQFKPEEIDVKVVDNCVVVEAKHEEKRDEHGWVSRQFTRKYLIPDQCNLDQVSSKLSSDGVLTIIAPRKEKPSLQNEKVIRIEHTGKPAMKAQPIEKKEETKEAKKEEKKK